MSLKVIIFRLIFVFCCGVVHSVANAMPAFDLQGMHSEGIRSVLESGSSNSPVVPFPVPPKLSAAATLVNIDLLLSYPFVSGVAGEDALSGIKITLELTSDEPVEDNLYYNYSSRYKDAGIGGAMASGYFYGEYHYRMQMPDDVHLELSCKQDTIGHSGFLSGYVVGAGGRREQISLTLYRSAGSVYTLSGNGLSLKLEGRRLTGTVREDLYSRKAIVSILTILLMPGAI